MTEPTKYKSLTYSEVESRQGTALDASTKSQLTTTLNKFIELFKLKHL